MSAYIVTKEHIRYLVEAAISRRILGQQSAFHWFRKFNQTWGELTRTNKEHMAEVANMLWLENIRSVSYRYPNESSATLPGPRDFSGFVIHPHDFATVIFDSFEPTQVLKACDCLGYQSSEHPEWEESESYAFLEALRRHAWQALPDYAAAVWGTPKTIEQKRHEWRAAQITNTH